MVLHILIATALTWLALVFAVHTLLFVLTLLCRLRGMSVRQLRQSVVNRTLLSAGALTLFPVFVVYVFSHRIRRMVAVLRVAWRIVHTEPTEIDLTVLAREEQVAFVRRIESSAGEEKLLAIKDAAARVREVQHG